MREENKYENSCRIFSIFFKNYEAQYDFGKTEGKAEINLKKIAELGKTKKLYLSNSLQELSDSFKEINRVIKNNFGLKINQKIFKFK